MKELLLLRHAKSSWDEPGLSDAERPLAPRGRRAAPRMGRELAQRGWLPDLVLVSPARRAQQTWRLVSSALKGPAPAIGDGSGLYMATPGQLLAALHKVPEEAGRVLVVGHNPGMEDFASLLAGNGSGEDALERMREKYPTAALARFAFDGRWDALAFGGARLLHFMKPKDFSASA
ncbi:histidine phosphatase family protein [Nitratireductor sp. GZWM139]|uniref:SixA phosphatase family protein n=1 Tax=Nitratireductor sp. GZWM139 TaxID=2950541 RepID=UPI0024BE046D|nr:histidine phosphatase family protein [Nitratireductor sp. GZWM139]MDJ1462486.1 histidine phosphatase family protein [Nitratireductor sp. GZWM139]